MMHISIICFSSICTFFYGDATLYIFQPNGLLWSDGFKTLPSYHFRDVKNSLYPCYVKCATKKEFIVHTQAGFNCEIITAKVYWSNNAKRTRMKTSPQAKFNKSARQSTRQVLNPSNVLAYIWYLYTYIYHRYHIS